MPARAAPRSRPPPLPAGARDPWHSRPTLPAGRPSAAGSCAAPRRRARRRADAAAGGGRGGSADRPDRSRGPGCSTRSGVRSPPPPPCSAPPPRPPVEPRRRVPPAACARASRASGTPRQSHAPGPPLQAPRTSPCRPADCMAWPSAGWCAATGRGRAAEAACAKSSRGRTSAPLKSMPPAADHLEPSAFGGSRRRHTQAHQGGPRVHRRERQGARGGGCGCGGSNQESCILRL